MLKSARNFEDKVTLYIRALRVLLGCKDAVIKNKLFIVLLFVLPCDIT